MEQSRRYAITDDYREIIQTARELEIAPMGASKSMLVNAINAKLDSIELEMNEVSFNLIEVVEILTETEFQILSTLLQKIEDHKENLKQDDQMNELMHRVFGSPFEGMKAVHMFGMPGVGKTSTMEEFIKSSGLNVKFI